MYAVYGEAKAEAVAATTWAATQTRAGSECVCVCVCVRESGRARWLGVEPKVTRAGA